MKGKRIYPQNLYIVCTDEDRRKAEENGWKCVGHNMCVRNENRIDQFYMVKCERTSNVVFQLPLDRPHDYEVKTVMWAHEAEVLIDNGWMLVKIENIQMWQPETANWDEFTLARPYADPQPALLGAIVKTLSNLEAKVNALTSHHSSAVPAITASETSTPKQQPPHLKKVEPASISTLPSPTNEIRVTKRTRKDILLFKARKFGIPGCEKMTKEELLKAVQKKENDNLE